MDLSTGVAARLAAVGLDTARRLTPQLMASAAVRCGLLVDLAAERRLLLTDDSIELDASPTGFPVADSLLLAMEAEPERTLDSWFDEERIGLEQVADSLVETGAWARRRSFLGPRYTVGDPVRRRDDLRLDITADAFPDAGTAAVAALGASAHLVGAGRTLGLAVPTPEVPPHLLEAVGEHGWALTAAVDHLRSLRAGYAAWPSSGSGGLYG